MMWKKKSLKPRSTEEKIAFLQAQREVSKARIREIRACIHDLIAQAAEADDVDRKMLSVDFETQKGMLDAETEHFTDLNRLIFQLRGVQIVQARQDTLSDIEQAGACIDTDALIRAEDALAVRREMKQEADDRLADAFAASAVKTAGFSENEEFVRLVRREQALRAGNAVNKKREEPEKIAL